MSASGTLEQILSLYWEGDRSEVQKKYDEELLMVFLGEDNKPDLSLSEKDDIEKILEGLFGQIGFPKPVKEQIKTSWGYLDEQNRIYAFYHLILLDNQLWSTEYVLEGLINFLGVQTATHALHVLAPRSVFPIDSEQRYDRLRKIFRALGITYNDGENLRPFEIALNIQHAVEEFREAHNLEDWQMWAVVYDLGPRLLPPAEPYPIDQPPRIWITAAGKENFATVDQQTGNDRDTWSINPKAKRGDIVLMYCLSPRSSIVAAYRCDCDAYRDPFNNWWTGVWTEITDKLEIPPLTLKEMKADPILSKWHMARANFQGMLQHQVPDDVWQRIKEITLTKDPETGRLLEEYAGSAEGIRSLKTDIASEKSFEDQALLPLLKILGWKLSSTLRRQYEMDIKVGSGPPRRVRADLVGFRVSAEVLLVIESKRRIRSEEELHAAVEQCESYAGKLRCPRFAVAAPEGVWIYDLQFPGQSQLLKQIVLDNQFTGAKIDKLRPLLGFNELLVTSSQGPS
ncbi:MAG: hypothetical protein O2954_04320 [bacterium]|nr:hypothetical protein [bacterium]